MHKVLHLSLYAVYYKDLEERILYLRFSWNLRGGRLTTGGPCGGGPGEVMGGPPGAPGGAPRGLGGGPRGGGEDAIAFKEDSYDYIILYF